MFTQWTGCVCNTNAKLSHGEPVYKFEVCSFSRSGDIILGLRIIDSYSSKVVDFNLPHLRLPPPPCRG